MRKEQRRLALARRRKPAHPVYRLELLVRFLLPAMSIPPAANSIRLPKCKLLHPRVVRRLVSQGARVSIALSDGPPPVLIANVITVGRNGTAFDDRFDMELSGRR
jgi:hypothetical protein